MGCQIFVYDSLLNQPSGALVQLLAINKRGTLIETRAATSATAGYGAILNSTGEYDVLVREGSNLLSPSSVKHVNGHKPNRLDLVMYPLARTPKAAGRRVTGTAGKVRQLVDSQIQQAVWTPDQGAAVQALFSSTSLLLQLPAPDQAIGNIISDWTRMLGDFGIVLDD
jgi:hypothetical protein